MAAYRITAFIRRMDKIQRDIIKASKEVKRMRDTGKAERIYGTTFHKSVRDKK